MTTVSPLGDGGIDDLRALSLDAVLTGRHLSASSRELRDIARRLNIDVEDCATRKQLLKRIDEQHSKALT
jgi:hypothetical protein